MPIKFVVATRLGRNDFMEKSATGRSLRLVWHYRLQIYLAAENREGLPKLYNRVIEGCRADPEPSLLVFAHDDVHLLDYFWPDAVAEGLREFPIIGVAGNRRRVPRQPGWPFADERFTWDGPNLSGSVGHGKAFPPEKMDVFGPTRQPVKLLDGLFLAASSETFLAHDLRFDERFAFHFYDMDLCRQAEAKGLRCGTWPIPVIHESTGAFRTPAWQAAYAAYLAKWGD